MRPRPAVAWPSTPSAVETGWRGPRPCDAGLTATPGVTARTTGRRQPVRVTTTSARAREASRTGPSGSGASAARASSAQRRGLGAGLLHRRVRAQQRERLGVQRRRRSAARTSSSRSRASAGSVERQRVAAPAASATPSRRSVPGVLPDSPDVADATSSRSSASWKATPIRSPYCVQHVDDARRRAGEHRAEPAGGRDQRAGLVGEDRRGSASTGSSPSAGPDGLADLAGAPAARRSAPGSARPPGRGRRAISDARANRKSPVRIATVLSQRALADGAPRRSGASSITSSWYSVARWVSSTTTAAGDQHRPASRVAELRGQQHEQRAEPLAAGLDQVAGRLGDERVVAARPTRAAAPRPRRGLARPSPRAPGRRTAAPKDAARPAHGASRSAAGTSRRVVGQVEERLRAARRARP